VKEC